MESIQHDFLRSRAVASPNLSLKRFNYRPLPFELQSIMRFTCGHVEISLYLCRSWLYACVADGAVSSPIFLSSRFVVLKRERRLSVPKTVSGIWTLPFNCKVWNCLKHIVIYRTSRWYPQGWCHCRTALCNRDLHCFCVTVLANRFLSRYATSLITNLSPMWQFVETFHSRGPWRGRRGLRMLVASKCYT